MLKIISILLIIIGGPLFITAQTNKDLPIELKACSINVEAGMFIATTTLSMEFHNPNNKVMDGQYDFALQQGQVITGFALDIEGKLRDGVIVDKKKGRVAYENTIRRRVDPGLLEMTTGDNYRVRIYPMPAAGTRKIRIIISQVLDIKSDALQYFLPLNNTQTVNEFTATVKITSAGSLPKTGEGILENLSFFNNKDTNSLVVKKQNIVLNKPLAFKIPLGKNFIISDSAKGEYAVFSTHFKLKNTGSRNTEMRDATVFWDVSASASQRDRKKEIEFLEKFIKQQGIQNISIVSFSNAIHSEKRFLQNNFNKLSSFIEKQELDGATQLGILDCNNYKSDVFLLFSDGLSNFGDSRMKTGTKMLITVNSSPVANHSLLQNLADKTGGNYVDLGKFSVNEVMKEMDHPTLQLLNVSQDGKAIQHSLKLPLKVNQWLSISGIAKADGKDVEFTFGRQGMPVYVEKINFASRQIKANSQLNEMYLLQQFATLQTDVMNTSAITNFAQQNEFVSSTTSFIVLDNLDDYIEHGIVPPAELLDEYAKKLYVVNQKAQELSAAMQNEEINNLRKAALLYNDRIKWWGAADNQIDVNTIQIKASPMIVKGTDKKEDNASNERPTESGGKFKTNSNLQEVVIVGYGSQRRRSLTGSVTTVNASQLNTGATTIAQALQGRVPGVQIISGGAPGAAEKIIIRGASSMRGGQEPLYVLDGFPIDATIVNTLSPANIQSVTILKDVQASAIYGSRAANGAIVITSQTGVNTMTTKGIPRYKDLEDVDYVTVLKEQDAKSIYTAYLQMKKEHEKETDFFADAAQVLFEAGEKELALRTLSNMIESDKENHQLLRGMGYILESWGMYPEAIDVYKKVLLIKDEEPQSYRDLALAYERNGQYKEAIDMLYLVISKNFYQYEDRYRGIKSLLLNEMNAIIHRNSDLMCSQDISPSIIKPLPVDLRIVIDWNKDETDIDLHITDPDGEECFYGNRQTKGGGRLSEDFTQGSGPEEFQVKNALKGRYYIRVNYYGDRYQKQQVSPYIKLTIYKNYGQPNQSVSTEVFSLLNQNGKIEIGTVKF